MQAFPIRLLTVSVISLSLSAVGRSQVSPQSIPDRREFPVNEKINPCENFYDYACSKVIDGFHLRSDRSSHLFAFDDSNERLLEKKKIFLKDISSRLTRGEELAKRSVSLATVYNACMDPQATAAEEKSRVQKALVDLNHINSLEAFAAFLAAERNVGRQSFVTLGHVANQDQPELYDFYFDMDMMNLPERSYYENKSLVGDYKKVLAAFYQTVGLKDALSLADSVFDLESEFAKVYPRPEDWRRIMIERRNISREDLVKAYPYLQMEKLLGFVPETTLIRHFAPEAYRFFNEQLQKRSLETWKAVYLFRVYSAEFDDGFPAFHKTYRDFQVKHLGAPELRPDREERCTKQVMGTFSKEIDAELLPLLFPSFPEDKFISLAEDVRRSILNGIESNQWLSPEGKEGAKLKMEKARLQLVKPRNDAEWHFNPEVTYSVKQPLANMDRLNEKLLRRTFAELKTARDTQVWEMGPLTVNAYYSPDDNKFVMPLGILQYPFYDPELPVQVNMGSVGAVIGHELGHGIDDQGAMYDAAGRLKQWMSAADIENFRSRGAKFIEQFDKIGHNGKLTLGENIGDLTGVTFAFRAAFPDGEATAAEKRDFFLQYARVWCGVTLPKLQEKLLKTDPHSLGFARVNQQMKNQPEFAKAFQCKSTDAMVLPESQRVKIW